MNTRYSNLCNINIPFFLESKNEFTEHLVTTITPYIHEGLNSIYIGACKIAEQNNKTDEYLRIFQRLLLGIKDWNESKIEEETLRIKKSSNTYEYFDDLVKAVVRSNIILLTCSKQISSSICKSFYDGFKTSKFIHYCYIECGKDAYNYPFLFDTRTITIETKRNQILIKKNIEDGIIKAVRKILPLDLIIKEYLNNSSEIMKQATEYNNGAPNNFQYNMQYQHPQFNPNFNNGYNDLYNQRQYEQYNPKYTKHDDYNELNNPRFMYNKQNNKLNHPGFMYNKQNNAYENQNHISINNLNNDDILSDHDKIQALMVLDKMMSENNNKVMDEQINEPANESENVIFSQVCSNKDKLTGGDTRQNNSNRSTKSTKSSKSTKSIRSTHSAQVTPNSKLRNNRSIAVDSLENLLNRIDDKTNNITGGNVNNNADPYTTEIDLNKIKFIEVYGSGINP